MEVVRYNRKCYVTKASSDELEALIKCTKITQYRYEGKKRIYEGVIHLYNKEEKSFPSPYLYYLAEKLEKYDIDIEYEDERTPISHTIKFNAPLHETELYEDQVVALEKAQEEETGAFIKMTGGGKGRLIDELLYQKSVRTLIVVPSTGIQNDIYYRLKKIFPRVSVERSVKKRDHFLQDKFKKKMRKNWKPKDYIIGSDLEEEKEMTPEDEYLYQKGYMEVGGKIRKIRKASEVEKEKYTWPDVAVICYHSLDSLPDEYKEEVEMLLIDEGDTSACSSIRTNILEFENAYYLYVTTATFWRRTKEELELLVAAVGNNIIYEELPQETISKGQTMAPKKVVIDGPTPKRKGRDIYLRKIKGFDNIIKQAIVGNEEGNIQIVDIAEDLHKQKRRTIGFVWEEAHAQILLKRIEERNEQRVKKGLPPINAIIYHGKLKPKIKKEIETLASDGTESIFIIATTALGRGVDTRNIDTIALIDVRKSDRNLFQFIGRGTRRGTGRELLVINIKRWYHPKLLSFFYEVEKAYDDYYNKDSSYTEKEFKKHRIGLNRV